MPISAPSTPAITPPAMMASTSRTSVFSTAKPFSSQPLITAPVYAPMLMKPAWPRLSSPLKPMTRFSDTAMTTQQQMGTSWPLSERVMDLLAIID